MNIYNKILIAKKSEKNKCYGNDGDILYIASIDDKFKGKLPKDGHFFITLDEDRKPSLFGWVKTTEMQFTALDLAKMDYRAKYKKEPDNDNFISGTELNNYEEFLAKINTMKDDTAVAIDWTEQLNMDTYKKERRMWLHLVKFYKAG